MVAVIRPQNRTRQPLAERSGPGFGFIFWTQNGAENCPRFVDFGNGWAMRGVRARRASASFL